MTRPTMLTVIMMVEIAVSTSTPITALIVLVIILKIVQLVLLFLKLETVFVMTRPTMLTAITMVEIAVDHARWLANVRNVPVLVELMILVTVSPIVSSILKMGSILVFATKSSHPWKSWEGPGTEWDRTGLARDLPELFLKFPGLPCNFFFFFRVLFLSPLWFINIYDETEIQAIVLRLFNGPKSWLGRMLCYIMQNHKKHNSTNKSKNTLQNYKNQKNWNTCVLSHNFWTNLDLFHLFILVIKPYLSAH